MINKDLIPHPEALELKGLGFDEPCLKFYAGEELALGLDTDNGDTNSKLDWYNLSYVSAPTYSQAFRWLYQELDIEKGVMPLDTESQQLLLKELIDTVKNGK